MRFAAEISVRSSKRHLISAKKCPTDGIGTYSGGDHLLNSSSR